MPLASWKDLCIDVNDAPGIETFWGGALGLRPTRLSDGDWQLVGPTPAHAVWLNRVPERVTVKQRVHLDLHTPSVESLERLGARVLPGWEPAGWTVMADPEGGELCAFVREETPAYRLYEIVVDCVDAGATSRWWAEVLGARSVDDEEGFSYLEDAPGLPFDTFTFSSVPEPKTVKNRIHWDVSVDGDAGVAALVEAGATVLRPQDDEIGWQVLADPEGNEFCVFPHG